MRIVFFLAGVAATFLLAPAARAAPFAEPGDPVLREELIRLADRGCLAAPVTTWPVMWASLEFRDSADCERAGLDFRWGQTLGPGYSLGLYGQLIGEDEAGYLPSRHTWLGGVDWRFPHLGGRGLLYLEATDTTAGAFSGDEYYNYAFEHGTYQTGWRYRGRPLASTWGETRGWRHSACAISARTTQQSVSRFLLQASTGMLESAACPWRRRPWSRSGTAGSGSPHWITVGPCWAVN